MAEKLIDIKGVCKRYYEGQENELEVLHNIDLQINKGEFVAIVGESGSGKSTLMNIIGALDRPSEGSYFLDNIDMLKASSNDLAKIRNKEIGFVFQTFNLIGRTTAIKNVELPMMYAGVDSKTRQNKAKELLDLVDMKERIKHQPNELSGGQKQRVAIARAIANNPNILLADEPTGALDSHSSRIVMDIFHKLHKENNITVILVTHSQTLAEEAQRIITISDGCITGERRGSKADAYN